jgi:hypothetical protein
MEHEVPKHLVEALAGANGMCPACLGKKKLPARIQFRDGRPCTVEDRPCPVCQPDSAEAGK